MTKLESEKPVVRETAIQERLRPLVVELHPRFLILRLKGTRQAVTVHYDAIFDYARKRDARMTANLRRQFQ